MSIVGSGSAHEPHVKNVFWSMVCASVIVVVSICANPVGADQTATPAPVTAPTSAANASCPVGIFAIIEADKPEQSTSSTREFSAFLWSPDGPGVSTGTIWVNASGSAYAVPFTQRKVLSPKLSEKVDPITFRLPATAHLENAFIASLEGGDSPGPAPCSIFNPWVPSFNAALGPSHVARLQAAKSTIPAVDARPVADPEHACHAADVAATTLHNAPVKYPVGVLAPAPGLLVDVAVTIQADSSIERTTVTSPPRSDFDASALVSARAATYRTKIEHCRPVEATYTYVVEFTNH